MSHSPTRPTSEPSETDPLASRATSRSQSFEAPRKREYWSFWLLGAIILLTWNVLISSLPLFQALLPPTSGLRHTLSSYVTTFFTFGNFVFLGLAQQGVGKVSQTHRLRLSLYCLAASTALTGFPLLPAVFPILSPTAFFIVLIALTLSFSAATSYLQASVIAIAALHGSREMLGVMSGQGGIAVMISLVQVYIAVMGTFSTNTPPPQEGVSSSELGAGVGLWLFATIPIFLCIWLIRPLLQMEAEWEGQNKGRRLFKPDSRDEYEEQTDDSDIDGRELRFRAEEDEDMNMKRSRIWEMLKRNRAVYFSVGWVFVVTLAVFPPITTTILSVSNPTPKLLQPGVFLPIHFLIFNVSDYLGRTYLPAQKAFLITDHRKLVIASLARTLFIPLFLLCNTNFSSGTSRPTPWINSDYLYWIILFCFGATNGWISSLSMILASSPSLNPLIHEDEKDKSGSLAGFCLTAGLAVGSIASFLVRWIVRGGNPFVD